MKIKEDIFSVASLYDTFFIDMYGVLFDGSELYGGTLSTLKRLKEMKKKIVLVSNTSQLSADAMHGYAERDMHYGVHYDYFVTAGELLRDILLNHSDIFDKQIGKEFLSVKYLFMGNTNVFKNTKFIKSDTYEDADLIYVASPRAHYGSVRLDNLYDESGNKVELEEFLHKNWKTLRDDQGRQGLAEFALQLEKLATLGKTLFLSNPDFFAPFKIDNEKHPVVTQGAIGFYYEKFFGGKVLYFGKPFVEIFMLVAWGIFLSAGNPENYHAVAAVFLFKVLNVAAQVLCVVPTGIGGHCPKRIGHTAKLCINQILGIVRIKAGLHGLYALQLVTNRFNILFLKYLTIKCALVCIVGKHIPCTKDYVCQFGYGNNLSYMLILLFLTAAHAHFTQLGE